MTSSRWVATKRIVKNNFIHHYKIVNVLLITSGENISDNISSNESDVEHFNFLERLHIRLYFLVYDTTTRR